MPLEAAIEALATVAAYDLLEPPMLWHYNVVSMHALEPQVSRWADGEAGRSYIPVVLEVDNERLGRPYTVEAEFNRLPADATGSALLGRLPLLVRIQYINTCHTFNGAAAMALVRHAAQHHLRWTIRGQPVQVGWRWGSCPEGGVALTLAERGTGRVKHQAHAHQVATFTTASGARHLLDLSVAQFGSTAAVRCCPEIAQASCTGCAMSPTLRQRAASGVAPGLFVPETSPAAALQHCRLERGQHAVEAALAELDSSGVAHRASTFALCEHVMPRPLFRTAEFVAPGPDDDLVEGGVLSALRQFGHALQNVCLSTDRRP